MRQSRSQLTYFLRTAALLVAAGTGLAATLIPVGAGTAVAAASSGYTVAHVPVTAGGTQIAIDPATDTLYLAGGGELIVVNAATDTVQATVTLGNTIAGVAVDPVTDMVYVTDYVLGGTSSIFAIDGSTNTVAATIAEPAGSVPFGIAANSATDTVYVANYDGRNVTVIDGKTNAISATVSTGSTSHPYAVAVDDSTDVAWVTDWAAHTVTAIDGGTDTIAGSLTLPARQPETIAVDSATDTVYVGAREEAVYVIDGATATLSSTISVPYAVDSIAADPAAGVIYATDPGTTWIIDAGTNAITDTLGRGGTGVAPAATAGSAYETGSPYGLWLLTPSAANALSPVITSAAAATFTTGLAGSATVLTSALPAATLSESGPLPTGLTWNSDGTLAGTPAPGTGGYYPITITASNGVAPDYTQSFGVSVYQPIVITSASSATFGVGTDSSFSFQSTGYPEPDYAVSGALPAGVTLLWSQASGWQLTGTPAVGSGGVYPITVTAETFGAVPNVTQAFTLTVLEAPSFSSPAHAAFRAGRAGTFRVTAHGYPAVAFTVSGAVPSWARLSAAGALAGTPPAHAGGSYRFTISAGNGIGGPVTQPFTLTVDQTPAITTPSRATFRAGHRDSFTIKATGYPAARLTERGRLPRGITFRAGRNGTAVLTGDPARGDRGTTYRITIIAGNGVGPAAQQVFRLKVS
jgi:YVTN family beta-propeller protein